MPLPRIRRIARGAIVAMLLASPATLRAQDDARAALTVSTPTAVGMLWHLTDRLALRPELSATHSRIGSVPSAFGATVAVTALRYGRGTGATRTYFAPRFGAQIAFREDAPEDITWAAGLSLGAQHRLDRTPLMVFAEGGVQASWFTRDNVIGGDISGTQWTTRTTLGVAWYLGGR